MSNLSSMEKADIEVIILGNSRVGKSTTVAALNDQHYKNIDSTIGVSFSSKTFLQEDPSIPKEVRIKVWDTAGQERYRSLIHGYFINKAAALIMFDVTSRSSFEDCAEWLEQLKEKTNNTEIVISLVANKIEAKMEAFRKVSSEEAKSWADLQGIGYYEVSAIQNSGVLEMFHDTITRVLTLHPVTWQERDGVGVNRKRGLILYPSSLGKQCCVVS